VNFLPLTPSLSPKGRGKIRERALFPKGRGEIREGRWIIRRGFLYKIEFHFKFINPYSK
jgi:hypothetical protein